MKRLSNSEYKKKKRKQLERRAKNGNLDDNERPYLEFLRGNREIKKKPDYSYHKKAQKEIQRLHEDHKLYEIGGWSDKFSVSAIQRLYAGEFDSISEGYAQIIYAYLKKSPRDTAHR